MSRLTCTTLHDGHSRPRPTTIHRLLHIASQLW